MGRTQRFFRFRTLENLHKSRLFRVERSTKRFRFRVLSIIGRFTSGVGRFRPLRQEAKNQAPQGVADVPTRFGQS